MKPKHWSVEHEGHLIRATNQHLLWPPFTRERLEVDGVTVAEGKLGAVSHFATLSARVELAGRPRHVEARLGNKLGRLVTGCHLLVDGELIGGDADEEIDHPTPEQAREEFEGGFVGTLLGGRMLMTGLPYGAVVVLFQRPPTAFLALVDFALLTVMFGGSMCWVYWRSLRQQVEGYARCGVLPASTDGAASETRRRPG